MEKNLAKDLQEFITEIKDPSIFVKYCNLFHIIEDKAEYYMAAYKERSKAGREAEGIKIILDYWNPRVGSTMENIRKAYQQNKEDLNNLKGKRLQNLNPNGNDREWKKIEGIFVNFLSELGPVGASKALNLLLPKLFMMWDKNIIKSYHSPHLRQHKEKGEKCYIEFMKESSKILKNLLKQKDENEILEMHSPFFEEEKKKYNMPLFREWLPKMLDECNYVRYTKNRKLIKKGKLDVWVKTFNQMQSIATTGRTKAKWFMGFGEI
jgi:hypothetical protein